MDIDQIISLVQSVSNQAIQSEELQELAFGEDREHDPEGFEAHRVYLHAISRSLRAAGVDIKSMVREVEFHNQFEPTVPSYEVPLYFLQYQGTDFASHGIRDGDIESQVGRLIDTDHHGAAVCGWGQAHDISRAEDQDPQEEYHDWFDACVTDALAQKIDLKTRKVGANRPKSRL